MLCCFGTTGAPNHKVSCTCTHCDTAAQHTRSALEQHISKFGLGSGNSMPFPAVTVQCSLSEACNSARAQLGPGGAEAAPQSLYLQIST